MLRSFFLPTALFTNTSPSSSTSIQSGAECAEPSSFSVTRWAKFFPFSKAISRSVRSATSTLLRRSLDQPQAEIPKLFVRDGGRRAGERVAPDWALGNAITSRIASLPVNTITSRSIPGAMPACGGTPYRNALIRCPNFSSISSAESPNLSNTLRCRSGRWIRTLPLPSSKPFRTMSYARAFAVSGARSSVSGAVNGWCCAAQR